MHKHLSLNIRIPFDSGNKWGLLVLFKPKVQLYFKKENSQDKDSIANGGNKLEIPRFHKFPCYASTLKKESIIITHEVP